MATDELKFEVRRARDAVRWEWWIVDDPDLGLGMEIGDWPTPEVAAESARRFAARCCLKPVITMPR